jgi:hypothetical protein
MFVHKATGFQKEWKKPILNAEQFTAWDFTYAAYDQKSNTATVRIESGKTLVKEDRLPRGGIGSYGKTNVNVEPQSYILSCGTAQAILDVNTSSHPDIEAILSPDAVCAFDAFGRSNTENNAASWTSGSKYMEFEEVLWSVNNNGAGSGWYKDRLLLSNGASMTLTADGGGRREPGPHHGGICGDPGGPACLVRARRRRRRGPGLGLIAASIPTPPSGGVSFSAFTVITSCFESGILWGLSAGSPNSGILLHVPPPQEQRQTA